jgi:hypothetical protein
LNNEQLQADNGKHQVELHLHPVDTNKLLEAIKKNKGFRFGKQNIQGGSILGIIVKGVRKYVPKELVKSGLTMGADALGFMTAGTPVGQLASSLVDKAVDDVYAGKKVKHMAKSAIKQVKNHALSKAEQYARENYPEQFGLMKKLGHMDQEQLQNLAI